MPGIRAAVLLMLLASSVTLPGCGLGVDARGLFASDLEQFAREMDRVCVESFHRGVNGEEAAERRGEEEGWASERIEAEIRYAWASSMRGQYRAMEDLGSAPERAALVDRWVRTALERSRLYRRAGDAWLRSEPERAAEIHAELRLAKLAADHLAGPLPLRACGRPIPGTEAEPPTRREQLADPPLRHTAEFPLRTAPLLRRIDGVYWRHQVAGRVTRLTPGTETVLAEIVVRPRFARRAIDCSLQLFRGRKDPSVTWIAMVPRDGGDPSRC